MSTTKWGEVGTEDDWREGLGEAPEDPEPLLPPPAAPEAPVTFHTEMLQLMEKYGLMDYFYIVRSADGKEGGMTWGITARPDAEDYRDRCARVAFECHGLLQHMEGSTWLSVAGPG